MCTISMTFQEIWDQEEANQRFRDQISYQLLNHQPKENPQFLDQTSYQDLNHQPKEGKPKGSRLNRQGKTPQKYRNSVPRGK